MECCMVICYMALAPKYILVVYNNANFFKNIYLKKILFFCSSKPILNIFILLLCYKRLLFTVVHSMNVRPTILLIIFATLLWTKHMLRVKLWPLIIIVLQEVRSKDKVDTLLHNKKKKLSLAYFTIIIQVVNNKSYKTK